jgi:formylmethanofuran dehydrogenase subunit E
MILKEVHEMRDASSSPELQRCVEFHGHFCPGLTIGYRASLAGLERLGARRAEDEELIAIVENNSCSVDAVQVLTGCTFGKGNLFFRDYGKQVFTFALRPSGRAVRVALKPRERQERAPSAPDREARAQWLLDAPVERIFDVREMTIPLPGEAEIHESLTCARCGEPVMATRTKRRGSQTLCIPCAEQQP